MCDRGTASCASRASFVSDHATGCFCEFFVSVPHPLNIVFARTEFLPFALRILCGACPRIIGNFMIDRWPMFCLVLFAHFQF